MKSYPLQTFGLLCLLVFLVLQVGTHLLPEQAGIDSLVSVLSYVLGFLIFSAPLYDWFRSRGLEDDRILLLRELATLLRCGIPLQEAFEALARARKKSFEHRFARCTRALSQAAEKAGRGASLGEVFSSSKVFPEHWGPIAEQGAARGDLPDTLDSLAAIEQVRFHLPWSTNLRFLVVLPMLLGIVYFLSIYIMPTFTILLESSGVQRHWTTAVISFGNSDQIWIFQLVGALLLGCSMIYCSIDFRLGRFLRNGICFLPGLWGLHRCEQQARIFQTLAIGLKQGLPQGAALRQAGQAATLKSYSKALEKNPDSSLSEVLKASPKLFDQQGTWLVEQGETFENLPEALGELAAACRSEYQRKMGEFTIKVDTLILGALGLSCGIACVGLFRAYIDVVEAVVNGVIL